MLQAQKRAYFVAQEALRREDELKRISKINEEEDEEEAWGGEDGRGDNVSADLTCYQWFCAAFIGKTRQDKMICNEKMKVAPPPPTPHLKGCPVACCVSLPLHSIPSSSSHQHQGLLISTWWIRYQSKPLWQGCQQSFDLIWFQKNFYWIRLKYWTV